MAACLKCVLLLFLAALVSDVKLQETGSDEATRADEAFAGVDNSDWYTMIATQNWNNVIDDLLKQLSVQMISQGKDNPSIDNLEESFEKGLGPVRAVGRFEATGGSIKNMSTLHRRSDVIVSSVPGISVTLNTQLGFSDLHIRYPHYKAKIWKVGPSGEINARVEQNSVDMTLRIDMNPDGCSIVLEAVKVRLGKLATKVTGLRPFNWLLSKIFNWLTHECQTDIVKTIESVLSSQLRYVFANTALAC